jgi:hypothetical protein
MQRRGEQVRSSSFKSSDFSGSGESRGFSRIWRTYAPADGLDNGTEPGCGELLRGDEEIFSAGKAWGVLKWKSAGRL